MPENCNQGIFFNGSAKKRIVAVFILYGMYRNKEGSEVHNILRNRVGDKGSVCTDNNGFVNTILAIKEYLVKAKPQTL